MAELALRVRMPARASTAVGPPAAPCPHALGFRPLGLAARQVTLPIGFAGLAMLFEEFGGTPVHLGRLIVNGGRTLMRRDMPVLMLLVLAVRLTHEAKALTIASSGRRGPIASLAGYARDDLGRRSRRAC